jgi:ABC-type multidrug transport system fused ATPase/permease subunit
LDKVVGQGALRLSGGELLRVAIARAIIRNAPVVVLDEYTSALDSETEQQIQNNINVALANKLKIVIAHRLSTIQDADNIIVLDNGGISEQGKFNKLMERNGLFKQFWEKQHRPSKDEI